MQADSTIIKAIIDATRSVTGPGEHHLHIPDLTHAEKAMVGDCIDDGFVSSVGPMIPEFEDRIKGFTGADHAVAMSSGTAAIHIALLAAGIKPGDEVLVPALTFVATGNAILYTGAVPHFVESTPDGFGIDPAALTDYLSRISSINDAGELINTLTGRVIRCLLPVHIFGHIGAIETLSSIARQHNLMMVEDAAEALGSFSGGTHAGLHGDAGIISFNGNKLITTGGGGCLITNNASLAETARHLSTTAKKPHAFDYFHDQLGFNYRMNNLNAALGVAQMGRLDGLLKEKISLLDAYRQAFSGIDGASIYVHGRDEVSNYWLQALVLDKADYDYRDTIITAAHENGLLMRPIWRLLSHLPAFADCPRMDMPQAEALVQRIINLPSSSHLGRLHA